MIHEVRESSIRDMQRRIALLEDQARLEEATRKAGVDDEVRQPRILLKRDPC